MNAERATVLLVEDNPSDAELIIESLTPVAGATGLQLVRDGVEALDYLLCRGPHQGRSFDQAPRLVLLDVKLPRVDGLEVLRALKADSRTRTIPVVMLTSSNIVRDIAVAYRLGANSYVQKPVDFERFRDTVRLIGRYWLSINEPPPADALEGTP